jgi:hypothetical protein
VHPTPRRPPSGSTLSLPFLLEMPPSTTPRRSQPVGSSHAVPTLGLGHVMSGSALPTVLQSASRKADFSGLPGSLLLRPAKLLAPCADLTGVLPATWAFTSRLPTSRSPFSPLDITTTVTVGVIVRYKLSVYSRCGPPPFHGAPGFRVIRTRRLPCSVFAIVSEWSAHLPGRRSASNTVTPPPPKERVNAK